MNRSKELVGRLLGESREKIDLGEVYEFFQAHDPDLWEDFIMSFKFLYFADPDYDDGFSTTSGCLEFAEDAIRFGRANPDYCVWRNSGAGNPEAVYLIAGTKEEIMSRAKKLAKAFAKKGLDAE